MKKRLQDIAALKKLTSFQKTPICHGWAENIVNHLELVWQSEFVLVKIIIVMIQNNKH